MRGSWTKWGCFAQKMRDFRGKGGIFREKMSDFPLKGGIFGKKLWDISRENCYFRGENA